MAHRYHNYLRAVHEYVYIPISITDFKPNEANLIGGSRILHVINPLHVLVHIVYI